MEGLDHRMDHQQFLDQIKHLNVNKSGDRRAPHKPLLLLIAIAKLLHGQHDITFTEIEKQLAPLLHTYAPPVKGRHQPELPYWHLKSDNLWRINGADDLPRQAGGFPKIPALRKTSGHLTQSFAEALLSSTVLTEQVVQSLLVDHFPVSLHDDIIAAVGLDLPETGVVMEQPTEYIVAKRRDPKFREKILRAYEYRCAATGFRAALGGSYFGCEAAHVQWHAYEGPDTVDNGMTLEPTLHKLFDAGAWSLTDDRKILVSADFTGTGETVERVRGLHGQPLREPQPGNPLVSIQYIRWHRESDKGGVFREPALPI